MAFDKEEVKQLKELFSDQEKRINTHTEMVVENKVNELAIMTAKGFNEVHQTLNKHSEILDKHSNELSEIRKDIHSQEFKVSETVHKVEFHQLEGRVDNIETKLKIA